MTSLSNRLLLIRRGFGCLALGFAQRSLLLLFFVFPRCVRVLPSVARLGLDGNSA